MDAEVGARLSARSKIEGGIKERAKLEQLCFERFNTERGEF